MFDNFGNVNDQGKKAGPSAEWYIINQQMEAAQIFML